MPRKKTIESVQETQLPRALIINGGETSTFLVETLGERGCQVVKLDSYSPTSGKYDYIFLFDNQEIADKIFENNLKTNGKFILVETQDEIAFPFRNKFKILKVGDPLFWSLPELSDKILRTLFSSAVVAVDLRRKPVASAKIKKEEAKIALLTEEVIPPKPKEKIREEIKLTPPLLEKKHRFNFRKIFLSMIFILLGILLLVGAITYWYLINLEKTFADLEYHTKTLKLVSLVSDLKNADRDIKTMQGIYNFLTNIFFPLKNISSVRDAGIILDAGDKLVVNGADFVQNAVSLTPSSSGFGETANISKDKLQIFSKKLADFTASAIDAQGKIDKVNLPYFPRENIQTVLSPIISQLTSVYEVLPVFADVFWGDAPKVYLVLFQNNMELRPTGGFIGSFGLLTASGGKIVDFKVEDVYVADGQLKGHVDPPAAIRKYLQQPHFFLRDSNFNPDFAASAAQASWFFQKEMGKNVDGVIGVNLTLAQKFLKVVGPIKLADFGGEEITADNFFYKVHYLSQNNFFPGSTEKKDVLTALATGILAKINEKKESGFLELFPVVAQALEEKNILIFLDNERAQKLIEDHGWAGRMIAVSCSQQKGENGQTKSTDSNSCFSDYLSVIEANLGVNKANYFISKSEVLEKKIDSNGTINSAVTISYENINNTVVLTPQTYVNYLRVFVPAGSKLISVTVNNAAVASADIDTENYSSDKMSFGFLVKIAPDNRGVVKISYTLPRTFSKDNTSYQLFYQKQAGDKNSPLIFSMTFPDQFKLKPVNFSSSAQGDNEIYYTTDTSVDRVFALTAR